jgi:hypothetical protein
MVPRCLVFCFDPTACVGLENRSLEVRQIVLLLSGYGRRYCIGLVLYDLP